MRRLGRVIEGIVNIGGYFSGWLVAVMMVLILYEVFMRYVLNQPPMVADEFSGYILVALTFLGAAYTWKERGHVRIELLVRKLPDKAQVWLRLITVIMAAVFALLLIEASYELVSDSYIFGRRSGSWLRTPLLWPQLVLIIGSVLLFVQLITEVIKALGNLKKSKEKA